MHSVTANLVLLLSISKVAILQAVLVLDWLSITEINVYFKVNYNLDIKSLSAKLMAIQIFAQMSRSLKFFPEKNFFILQKFIEPNLEEQNTLHYIVCYVLLHVTKVDY